MRPAALWLTREIREQRFEPRRCDRRWRTTGLTVDREACAQKSIMVNNLISSAKKIYYSELIGSCATDRKELFRIVQSLNSGSSEKQFPHERSTVEVLADRFVKFFKVRSVSSGRTFSSEDNSSQLTDLKSSNMDLHSGELEWCNESITRAV